MFGAESDGLSQELINFSTDKVTIEMSPYDLTKGRIIWRDK